MSQITVKFGASNSASKDFADGINVGQIIADSALQSLLGYGESVEAYVDGALVPASYVPRNGQTVSLRTKANTKG